MALAPGRPPPPRRPRRDTDDKLRNQQSTREQLEPQASRGARRGRQERRRAAGSVYHVGTQEPRRPTVERQRPETNPNWTVGLTFPPRYGGAAERARGRTLDDTRETGLRRARYDPATHSAGHETRERPVDRPTTHARPDTGRHGGDETPPWGGTLRHPRRTAPDTGRGRLARPHTRGRTRVGTEETKPPRGGARYDIRDAPRRTRGEGDWHDHTREAGHGSARRRRNPPVGGHATTSATHRAGHASETTDDAWPRPDTGRQRRRRLPRGATLLRPRRTVPDTDQATNRRTETSTCHVALAARTRAAEGDHTRP